MTTTLAPETPTTLNLNAETLAKVNAAIADNIAKFSVRPKTRRGFIPLNSCNALGMLRKGEPNPSLVYRRVLRDAFHMNVPVNELTAYATTMAVGNDVNHALLAIAYLGNSRETMDCAVLMSLSGSIKERPAVQAFERILRAAPYGAAFAEAQLHFVHLNAAIRETALTVIAERYLPKRLRFAVRPVKWVLGKFYLPKAEPIRATLPAAA